MIRSAATLAFAFAMLAIGPTPALKAEETTKVVGLMFYADWCGKCKTLDPKLKAVMPSYEGQAIDFVWLDLTDETTTAASKAKAEELGFGELFAERAPKTGFMVLTDTSTKKSVGELSSSLTDSQIRQIIDGALAG